MAKQRRAEPLPAALRAVVGGTIWSFAWGGLASVALVLQPLPAIGWIAATLAAFALYPQLRPRRLRRRRAAIIGLRGLGGAVPWLTLAVVFFLATALFLAISQARLTNQPSPVDLDYRFASLRLGWAVLPLLVVGLVPLIEEVFMRGLVQGSIARRFGPLVGVCGAAAVFALIHASRAWLLFYLSLGLLFGYARVATRSIWAAVTLHGALNAIGIAFTPLVVTPDSFLGWSARASGWILGMALLASASVTVFALHRAGVSVRLRRGQRLRRAGPSVAPA